MVAIYRKWQCCGVGSSNLLFLSNCNLQYFWSDGLKATSNLGLLHYFVRNSHQFWTGRKEVMPGPLEKVGFEHPTLYSIQRKFEYILFFCLYNTNNSGFWFWFWLCPGTITNLFFFDPIFKFHLADKTFHIPDERGMCMWFICNLGEDNLFNWVWIDDLVAVGMMYDIRESMVIFWYPTGYSYIEWPLSLWGKTELVGRGAVD